MNSADAISLNDLYPSTGDDAIDEFLLDVEAEEDGGDVDEDVDDEDLEELEDVDTDDDDEDDEL